MRSPDEYLTMIRPAESPPDIAALADRVYRQTCRFDLAPVGFSVIDFGPSFGSSPMRQLMVSLKHQLARRHEVRTGRTLIVLSMGRFDQQVTTKPHRDGAPDESILMLGYEPTIVPSRLSIADYSRSAHRRGITPAEFLETCNPMFARGEELLAPETTELAGMNRAHFQILVINNSCVPFIAGERRLLGVLHQAEILQPMPNERRIVNSTMLGVAEVGTPDVVDAEWQGDFVRTTRVSGYKSREVESDDLLPAE